VITWIRRLIWPDTPDPPPYESATPVKTTIEHSVVRHLDQLEERLRVAEAKVGIKRREDEEVAGHVDR
jgi:hypothetical protein